MSVTVTQNHDVVEFDEKKLSLIRQTICKDASQEEFEVFMEICKSTQLNPLFKQIYFIKRGGNPTHMSSIDGLRLIADRTKRYVPGREPTFTYDDRKNLVSATSYVKKLAHDGTWHEVAASAFWNEYNAGVNLWKKMPHVMLAKCAEALALRRAFPADMLGIYTQEEMEQADHKPPIVPIPEPKMDEKIITEEAQEIENMIPRSSTDYRQRLLTWAKVSSFYELPRSKLADVLKSIEKHLEEKRKQELSAPPIEEQVEF